MSADKAQSAADVDFPPLYGPDDFSRNDLAGIRERASELLDSGFLLLTEGHYVQEIIERCDELIEQISPPDPRH
jgi:hypothetical protein